MPSSSVMRALRETLAVALRLSERIAISPIMPSSHEGSKRGEADPAAAGRGRVRLARASAGPLELAASCDSRGFKRATCLRVLQSDGAVETAERTRSPVDTGKEG